MIKIDKETSAISGKYPELLTEVVICIIHIAKEVDYKDETFTKKVRHVFKDITTFFEMYDDKELQELINGTIKEK